MKNVPENELFSAYLDGELTADEQASVERLLASSPAARQLMDELRALSSTLQSMPTYALEEDLTSAVLRAAERRVLGQKADGDDPTELPRIDIDAGGHPNIESAPSPWKGIGRRLLTPRNLLWPGIAVAVALMIMFSERGANGPANTGGEVAMRQSPSDVEVDREIPALQAAKEENPEKTDALSSRDATADEEMDRKPQGLVVSKGDRIAAVKKPKDLRAAGSAFRELPKGGHAHEAPLGADHPAKPAMAPPAESMLVQDAPAAPGRRAGGGGAGSGGRVAATENSLQVDAVPAEQDQAAQQQRLFMQGTTVVVCDVSPEAVRSRTFEKLLARHKIAWEGAGQDLRRLADKLAEKQTDKETDPRLAMRRLPAKSARSDLRESAKRQAGKGELELVLVEAAPARIKAALAALNSQSNDFVTVCVRPAPGQPDQREWTRYNRGSSPPRTQRKLGHAMEAAAPKPEQDGRSERKNASASPLVSKPAPAQAAKPSADAPAVRADRSPAPRPAAVKSAAPGTGKSLSRFGGKSKRPDNQKSRGAQAKPSTQPVQYGSAEPKKMPRPAPDDGHGALAKKTEAKGAEGPKDAVQGKSDDEPPTCRVLFVLRVAQPRDVAAAAEPSGTSGGAARAVEKPDAMPPAAKPAAPAAKP